jgi:hypothetical protein
MSGGSDGPYTDAGDSGDGEDIITLADVCAAVGELHGLFHHLRARVEAAEQRAAKAELRADVAVTLAVGTVPGAPGDELTSGSDQDGDQP